MSLWHWSKYYSDTINPKYRISIFNEWTPLEKANQEIDDFVGCKVYLKREDLSPTGSFKFRPLSYQISLARQNGHCEIIIPTSGNAGITAAFICQKAKIKAHVFVHPEIDSGKLKEIKKYHPYLYLSRQSIRQAKLLSTKIGVPNLRPSTDDAAIEGYKSLAGELSKQLPGCEAIFSYITSGSSIIGLGKMYQLITKESGKVPHLNAVQSGVITEIAEEFDDRKSEDSQLAGRGGIKHTRRKDEIIKTIKDSGGSAWITTNSEIKIAQKLLHKNKILSSFEGAASLAAAKRAQEKSNLKTVIIIISGKNWKN